MGKYSNFDELVDKCAGESEQAHILRKAEEQRKEQERKTKEEEARLKELERKTKEEEARLKELERKTKEKEEEVRLTKQKEQEARSKKEKEQEGVITKPKLKMKPMLKLHTDQDQKNCPGKWRRRLNNTTKLRMKPLLNGANIEQVSAPPNGNKPVV